MFYRQFCIIRKLTQINIRDLEGCKFSVNGCVTRCNPLNNYLRNSVAVTVF
jgi:hypothetical protein